MSLAPYSFRPITPPETAAGQQRGHLRNVSGSSNYTNESPESINSNSNRSQVYRQHGPTLLPKIRTQDNAVNTSAGQTKHKRACSNVSNFSNASNYNNPRPMLGRCATEPAECLNPMSPVSMASHSRASSMAPMTSRDPIRSMSVCSVDETMLNRYGYPTYRQMPLYVAQPQHTPSPTIYAQQYMQYEPVSYLGAPAINLEGTFDVPIDIESITRSSSTSPPPQSLMAVSTNSLLNYLTQPTQPVNLVRQLTFTTGRGLSSHFWWDVRNVRQWSSFSLDTMSNIPDLMTLLNFQHDTTSFPSLSSTTSTATPSSEGDLAGIVSKIFFPKVNAAACLCLGVNSPALYLAPAQSNTVPTALTNSNPTFLANYPSENQFTLHGTPRGRVVGLTKSFDRWNTGMQHEGPAQKVQYLKGLAHLQKCMRDHSCRYGFIITEIELVCVRAGCDTSGTPWFGYLEVSEGIATKTAAPMSSGTMYEDEAASATPLTVSLALFYLLMLAKQVPLPGQPGSFMDVGGPGAMTRQRTWNGSDLPEEEVGKEGRDKWIPEPQVGEKRDAKTARGWVWPSDPWHKREGGRRGRR